MGAPARRRRSPGASAQRRDRRPGDRVDLVRLAPLALDQLDGRLKDRVEALAKEIEREVEEHILSPEEALVQFEEDYAAELAEMKEAYMRRYHRILVRSVVTRPSRSFLGYHLSALRAAGSAPRLRDYGVAAFSELREGLANPGKLCTQLRDSLFRR